MTDKAAPAASDAEQKIVEAEIVRPANGSELASIAAVLPEQRECCKNCRYFHFSNTLVAKNTSGVCRRYPATMIVLGMGPDQLGRQRTVTQSFFPPMEFTGWCGEFALRLEQ